MKPRLRHVGMLLLVAAPVVYLWLGREQPEVARTSLPGGSRDPAAAVLEEAKRNAATNPGHGTLLELGFRYYQTRQFDESIAATQKAIEFDPTSERAYSNLCSAYAELGRWDEAVLACRKALSIDPNFDLAKGNLKWALDGAAKASAP